MKLPEPYYRDEYCTIYHGDCREILPFFADNSIDFVFTDPPYGHNNNDGGDLAHNWEAALGRRPVGCAESERPPARPIANDGPEANELVQFAFAEFNMTFIRCYLPARTAKCHLGALYAFRKKYPNVTEFGSLSQAASGAWYTVGLIKKP